MIGDGLLDFAVEAAGDVLRVRLHGNLDVRRYQEVHKALRLAESDSRPVLVMLDEHVRSVDTAMLAELLLFRSRLQRQNRSVAIHVADAQAYHAFAMTNVAQRLNASMSERQALKALRP